MMQRNCEKCGRALLRTEYRLCYYCAIKSKIPNTELANTQTSANDNITKTDK